STSGLPTTSNPRLLGHVFICMIRSLLPHLLLRHCYVPSRAKSNQTGSPWHQCFFRPSFSKLASGRLSSGCVCCSSCKYLLTMHDTGARARRCWVCVALSCGLFRPDAATLLSLLIVRSTLGTFHATMSTLRLVRSTLYNVQSIVSGQ